jgi:hypothetical protein
MTTPEPPLTTQDVFEFVLARPVREPDGQHGRLVHIAWRAPRQGSRLVQFYLNGQLAGHSSSPTQREAWLVVDHARHTEIELLAVEPKLAAQDRSHHLAGIDPATLSSVSLALLRDVSLPIDSRLEVTDRDTQRTEASDLFTPSDPRGGFGAVFGEGGFGYDASTGPGLGRGQLGYGPLGIDGDAITWRSDAMPPGETAIDLRLTNATGQPAAVDTILSLTIDRLPEPPRDLRLDDTFELTWT